MGCLCERGSRWNPFHRGQDTEAVKGRVVHVGLQQENSALVSGCASKARHRALTAFQTAHRSFKPPDKKGLMGNQTVEALDAPPPTAEPQPQDL